MYSRRPSASAGCPAARPFVPLQAVVRLARQCGLPAPEGRLALMATRRIADRWPAASIKTQGISKVKMYALLALLALHPEPVGRDELAEVLSAGRAVADGMLDALVGDGLAVWRPAPGGDGIRLTRDGLAFARHAVLPILGILHDCAVELALKEHRELARTRAHVCTCMPGPSAARDGEAGGEGTGN
jgi:hypothetical protein